MDENIIDMEALITLDKLDWFIDSSIKLMTQLPLILICQQLFVEYIIVMNPLPKIFIEWNYFFLIIRVKTPINILFLV